MRDLQAAWLRGDLLDIAGNPAKPRRIMVLSTPFSHKLHADTDAQKRPAPLPDGLGERLDHPGNGIKAAPAIRKRPDPGQHNPLGPTHHLRVAGDRDALPARP